MLTFLGYCAIGTAVVIGYYFRLVEYFLIERPRQRELDRQFAEHLARRRRLN